MKKQPSPLQKRSKYTNLPYARSESKKPNFGSNSIKRKPVSLHPVDLKGKSDDIVDDAELTINHLKPTEGPKIDEVYNWGFIRFENMTKEEYQKKYGKIK